MRFLVDENIGKSIVSYLRNVDHDVKWVKEVRPGISDIEILKLAVKERRVIITYDRDFGEIIFLRKEKHCGVILLHLSIDLVSYHLRALKNFLEKYADSDIVDQFWRVNDTYL